MNVSITSQTATQMRSAVMFTHCHTAISSPWLLTTPASLKNRSILDYHCGKYVVFYCRAVFILSSYLHRLCIEVFVFTNCQLYLSFFPSLNDDCFYICKKYIRRIILGCVCARNKFWFLVAHETSSLSWGWIVLSWDKDTKHSQDKKMKSSFSCKSVQSTKISPTCTLTGHFIRLVDLLLASKLPWLFLAQKQQGAGIIPRIIWSMLIW